MRLRFDGELHVSRDEEVESDDGGKSQRVNDTHMEAFWGSRAADVQHGALRESGGYWIKTLGLANVIREDKLGSRMRVRSRVRQQQKNKLRKKMWNKKGQSHSIV